MPAGSCRGIYSWPHGRCQPLHHTCKNGDNYAQRCLVSPPHLRRASEIINSSSQANLLVVGCVGFFFFCLFVNWYRGRERNWETAQYLIWDLFSVTCSYPMISHPFFYPTQVSWSDVLVLFSFIVLPGPGEPVWWFLVLYIIIFSFLWLIIKLWYMNYKIFVFIDWMLCEADDECTL